VINARRIMDKAVQECFNVITGPSVYGHVPPEPGQREILDLALRLLYERGSTAEIARILKGGTD
jgi:AcrR family transcriptional regulator